MFNRKSNGSSDEEPIEEQTGGAETGAAPSFAEELALIQRQVGELAELVESKDQEIEELRGNIRSEKSTFLSLSQKINAIEKKVTTRAQSKPLVVSSDADGADEEKDIEDEFEDHPEEDTPMIAFDEDTFSMMMLAPLCSRDWLLAFCAVSFQWVLLLLIFFDLVGSQSSPLNIPYSVDIEVTAGQFLGIFICVGVQTDVLSSVRMIVALANSEHIQWDKVIGVEDRRNLSTWLCRVLLPNAMKFMSGCMVLSVNFVTIVQSDNIVDLMKDVAALLIISEITEVFFKLAEFGFLGPKLEENAKIVSNTEVHDVFATSKGRCRINPRLVVIVSLVTAMGSAVGFFIWGQQSGSYFRLSYPWCPIANDEIILFGNGVCDGGILNSIGCNFDGGDCVNYNLAYPNCEAVEPKSVGDGVCNQAYNIPECDFDGADCCPFEALDPVTELTIQDPR